MRHNNDNIVIFFFSNATGCSPCPWRYVRLLGLMLLMAGWNTGNDACAQQLPPRYILTKPVIKYPTLTPGKDSTRIFGEAVPTNINGEMVGVANTEIPDLINVSLSKPHIYRLNSTGQYIDLINFKITTTYDFSEFHKVIPLKDSLYIIGQYRNTENQYWNGCNVFDELIIKTDRNGNVSWKKTWGDYNICETITDEVICADGGIAFTGNRGLFYLPDLNRGSGNYNSYKISLAKLNANGSVNFNKSYQIPKGLNTGEGIITDPVLAETPDKGYLLAATAEVLSDSASGLLLLKVDDKGARLWHKAIVENHRLFDFCTISDIIPHPAGGYLLIGTSYEESNLSGYYSGTLPTYKYGIILKISEIGDMEWIKKVRSPIQNAGVYNDINFVSITPITSSASAPGFIINGAMSYFQVPPINDSIYPHGNSSFQEAQTLIVKIDLNGDLLWDREYGAFYDDSFGSKVHEESGGSLVINSLASPFDANLPPVADADGYYENNPLNDKGILRLNDKGYLSDPMCSLSPILLLENNNNVLDYYTNNFISETTTTPIANLGGVTISHNRLPTTTNGICGNPLLGDFQYQISCSGTGSTVNFNNNSRGASWFQYDFGDPSSGIKNVSDSANPHHFYSAYRTYTVTLTAWDGDSSKTDISSRIFELKPPRHIAILASDTNICEGEKVNLTAFVSSGSYPVPSSFALKQGYANKYTDPAFASQYAVSYTDSTYNSIPLSTTFYNVSDSLNRTFSFYVSTFDNCVLSDTLSIIVYPTPKTTLTGDTLLCNGDSTLLMASGNDNYLWSPGGSTNDSLLIFPATTTTYTVNSVPSSGCSTNSAQIKVSVFALPTINVSENQTVERGTEVLLTASGSADFVWSPAESLSTVSANETFANPVSTTTYTVIATDANGCKTSDIITIYVHQPCSGIIYIPSAFSPNNDGTNDMECVQGNCIESLTFSIYDRWGNKVFESHAMEVCWDGTFIGKNMNSAIFVYSLQAVFGNGEIINQKGNITLFR